VIFIRDQFRLLPKEIVLNILLLTDSLVDLLFQIVDLETLIFKLFSLSNIVSRMLISQPIEVAY